MRKIVVTFKKNLWDKLYTKLYLWSITSKILDYINLWYHDNVKHVDDLSSYTDKLSVESTDKLIDKLKQNRLITSIYLLMSILNCWIS